MQTDIPIKDQQSPTDRPEAHPRWKHEPAVVMLLAALTLLGFLARLVLSWYSLGPNDWDTWHWFSQLTTRYGIYEAYTLDPELNHPPLPLLWSCVAAQAALATKLTFPFVFRLATIASDIGCCLLLGRIWTRRGGSRVWGWIAAAAFAWNLDAIMIGAYHCNTDSLCAFLTLLAAYLLAEHRNFFMGALALAGAINVKIVPVVLIPAFFSLCRNRQEAWHFFKGLAIGAAPFLLALCVTPETFVRNVFGYNSLKSEWGLMLIPMEARFIPIVSARAVAVTEWVYLHGKYPMLALTVILGIVSWRCRKWDAYQIGAMAWCVFLVFTTGWGMQYTVFVAPLLLAVDLARGMTYGLVAGLYLLTTYAAKWNKLPLESIYPDPRINNSLSEPLGFLAWGILVGFLAHTLWRGLSRKTAGGVATPD